MTSATSMKNVDETKDEQTFNSLQQKNGASATTSCLLSHDSHMSHDSREDHRQMMTRCGNGLTILDLPWEDVLFKVVFPGLPPQTLFQLRAVSHRFLECMTSYFEHMQEVDLTWAGSRFNASSFHLLVHKNTVLRSLVLRNAKNWLCDQQLLPVLSVNDRLAKVDLTNCTSISNACMHKLATSCTTSLREVHLKECCWLSSDGVSALATNCPGLERLDFTGCWQVDDDSITRLVTLCKQIRYLSVSKIYGLTDRSVNAVARHTANLRHLNIQGCWRVTDDAVRLLADHCPQLQMLQVRECRDVTLYSIARLWAKGVRVDVPVNRYQLSPELTTYLQQLDLK